MISDAQSRAPEDVKIPREILPADGRFGSGPSKIRPEAVARLADLEGYIGTSHRQAPVKNMVRRVKLGIRELFSLPGDYEVLLGIGGATVLWDALAFSFIEGRAQHLVFGEFTSKFAQAVAMAPHLTEPMIIESEPGTHPEFAPDGAVDVYATAHNETSTGVCMAVERPASDGFMAVDGTSAAAGMTVRPQNFDVYYFSPQKGLASDGGLWLAVCSPAAVERIEKLAVSGRYVPPSLDLKIALNNSRLDQTYNTPALATLALMVDQIDWINSNGGLEWSSGRCAASARNLYSWAEQSSVANPFVVAPDERSPVVGTIDFDESVDAAAIAKVLRANGIVDTEPYRKLGRNQLRIGMYPAVEPDDVIRLTRCIDHVIEELF
ncbi:MAG: phosphoserine transaminase [Actinomycetota bacterium]